MQSHEEAVPCRVHLDTIDTLRIGKTRREFHYALKAMLASSLCGITHPTGFISEHQSLEFLLRVGCHKMVKLRGIDFVTFRGLHLSEFLSLTSGRIRITLDCYISFFLPRFGKALEQQDKTRRLQLRHLYYTILRKLLSKFLSAHNCLRERLIINATIESLGPPQVPNAPTNLFNETASCLSYNVYKTVPKPSSSHRPN
ncbi:hypothetical protein CSKR_107105 [Clonorchis sinensis]|uniref:Uncharacterized protein n=1 Tax=Clonorchis sinensis TaxID=79923 RepID=A0A419Q0C3_CLOSI|nr:hypothetical protein CSKR_107105 [Clonorchis sinensis]